MDQRILQIIQRHPELKPEFEEIYPELKESEDERNWKELLEVIRHCYEDGGYALCTDDYKKYSAYLEKQKENSLGKYSEEENLAYRLNWVMQDYIKEGKDEAEKEHRFKCYQLFWDALEDTNFFEQKEQKPSTVEKLREISTPADEDWFEIQKQWEKEDEQKPAAPTNVPPIQSRNNEQKPVEWSEEYREEDLRTRFAFYTYKDEDGVLYLSNVFVEETSRNKGFGTKILQAAEKVAETIGAITIRLKVKQDSPANVWYRMNGYGYMTFEDGYDWLEKNLEYMKPTKQEWSEGDEKKIHFLSRLIEFQVKNDEYIFGDGSIVSKQEAVEMLKSLRPQPQQNMSISFMLYLDEIRPEGKMCLSNGECNDIEDAFKKQDWPRLFKYINKYQPHWKPSEEQMEALSDAYVEASTFKMGDILESLYNDLKKL